MITTESIKGFREVSRVLIRGADFMYLLPHPALRTWISNYTITFPSVGMMSEKYSVIPHGCATLVLSCGNSAITGSLFGPITMPAIVGSEANRFELLFIVEFQPAGYYAFSGMPQKELTDCVITFEDVNPAMQRIITQKLETSVDIESLIAEIDRLFLAHLKVEVYRQGFSLAREMIVHSGGLVSAKELSQNVFYSERQLSRIFDTYIGINPKSFSRLVRVNKAIRLMRRRDYSLTRVYVETGFYDMPHFINDFKSICGTTPQEYRNNMSDFYSEIAKF